MNVRKLTAQLLSAGLVGFSWISLGSTLEAASPPGLKQRVEQFGVGTELKIKLRSGEQVRGAIETIGDDHFTVATRDDGVRKEIAFEDLRQVRYPKRGYKAEGTPDAALAKRMVVQLGVGQHIMVKVSPTQKVRGHIREIHDDYFVIQPDEETGTMRVPYGSIWKVNKNLSFGATVAIVVGIAAAAILILVLSGNEEVDVI
jgi:ribosome maturation factor RimP